MKGSPLAADTDIVGQQESGNSASATLEFDGRVLRPNSRPIWTSPSRLGIVLAAFVPVALPVVLVPASLSAWLTLVLGIGLVCIIVGTGELQRSRSYLRLDDGRLLYREVIRERVVARAGHGDQLLEVSMSRPPQSGAYRDWWLLQDASGHVHLVLNRSGWSRPEVQALALSAGVTTLKAGDVRGYLDMGRRYPGSVPGWMLAGPRWWRRIALLTAPLIGFFVVLALIGLVVGAR